MNKKLLTASLVSGAILLAFGQVAVGCPDSKKVNGHCIEASRSSSSVDVAANNQNIAQEAKRMGIFAFGFHKEQQAIDFAKSIGLSLDHIVQRADDDWKVYLFDEKVPAAQSTN